MNEAEGLQSVVLWRSDTEVTWGYSASGVNMKLQPASLVSDSETGGRGGQHRKQHGRAGAMRVGSVQRIKCRLQQQRPQRGQARSAG